MGTLLLLPKKLTPLAELALMEGREPTKSEWKTFIMEGGAGYDDGEYVVRVPDRFTTDFASIPWVFRWWQTGSTGPQRVGAYFHDFAYSGTDEFTRREADEIFRRAMAVSGSGARRFVQRWLMWAALRVGGGLAFRSGQKKFAADPVWRIFK